MCGLFAADIQGEYSLTKGRWLQWLPSSDYIHSHGSDANAIAIPN